MTITCTIITYLKIRCSLNVFLIDNSNHMNCCYLLVFLQNPPSPKQIGHFSFRSCYSQLIASNSNVAFVFDGNITEFVCYAVFCNYKCWNRCLCFQLLNTISCKIVTPIFSFVWRHDICYANFIYCIALHLSKTWNT